MDNEQVIQEAIKRGEVMLMVEPHLKDRVSEALKLRYDYSHITVAQAVSLGCKKFWADIYEDEEDEDWVSLHTEWGDAKI